MPAGDFFLQHCRNISETWLGMLLNAQVFKESSDLLCFCLVCAGSCYCSFLSQVESVIAPFLVASLLLQDPRQSHNTEASDFLPTFRNIITSILLRVEVVFCFHHFSVNFKIANRHVILSSTSSFPNIHWLCVIGSNLLIRTSENIFCHNTIRLSTRMGAPN